jgi:hypothetical protein
MGASLSGVQVRRAKKKQKADGNNNEEAQIERLYIMLLLNI